MAITPPGAGAFTTIHFIVLALLIAVTLLALIAGVRRSRARKACATRVENEAAEAGVPEAPDAPAPSALRDAPLDAHALDRSAAGFERSSPADDDLVRPHPVAAGPGDTAPLAQDAPSARPLADEPIAAAAPMDASPATQADPAPASAPVEASPAPADGPVTQLKGLGPKVAARLAELGVTTVGQIAALDADQAQALDGRLGPFAGRLHRDRWVEQARFLAAGDKSGFEAVFGRL